jgi:GT2 family glycosyltransferase
MKLSVIIVNYNVKAYLEQCLRTVFAALEEMAGEVFVVDNLSTDGSVEMVREKFPQVRLIANRENVGFSRANNQAVRESSAEYVLLLNPDTVVGEDVFRKVVAFLDADPRIGGLGVKMIDGKGRFLPESKRGLPTPAVAFYKIIGLARLFPRSRLFGRYHLGHLPENEAAPIEILSGACMFLRKSVLDEVGLLDEKFFMYGEDIDLSYRITLGGYDNWYFPEARIIHYKGESTKKSSVNYVFVFYNAMAIFARKHFARSGPQLFSLLIRAAIYLSAAGAIVTRFLRSALLPILDAVFILGGVLVLEALTGGPASLFQWGYLIPMTLLVLAWAGLFGAYDRPVRLLNVAKALALPFFAVLLGNWFDGNTGSWLGAFGPLALVVGTMLVLARLLLHVLRVRGYNLRGRERQRVLVIGSAEESRNVLALLWQRYFGLGRQEQLDPSVADMADAGSLIRRRIRKQGIDEVVFCAKDLKWGRIIALMDELERTGSLFKIAQPAREFIIGPSTIESLQDLLIIDDHAVNSAVARRRKRTLDIVLSILFLATLPIGAWFVRDKAGFVRNILDVLRGRRSWFGYFQDGNRFLRLPRMRPGVLDPISAGHLRPASLTVQRVNLEYAKDYRVWRDLRCVLRNFHDLGEARRSA